MKMLNEKVSLQSSMVYELLGAMFRLECHEKMIPEGPQYAKYLSEDLVKWVDKTRARLTSEMKKELNVFFNYESYLGLSLVQLIWKKGLSENLEVFFNFLHGYPAKDLVRKFFDTGYAPEEKPLSIDDTAAIKSYLNNSSLPEVEKWKLLYFCSEPEEIKNRFINLLEGFYNQIFKENLETLQEIHLKSLKDMEETLKENYQEKLKKLIQFDIGNATAEDKVILIPSYYYNVCSLFSYDEGEGRLIFLYGTALPELEFTEDISPEKTVAAIKILSDETRVKALGVLNTTPCYGYELSQKLGISSSTMSHHLSLLSSIEVISPVKEENKVYYEVNKDKIRKLLKQFEDMLT